MPLYITEIDCKWITGMSLKTLKNHRIAGSMNIFALHLPIQAALVNPPNIPKSNSKITIVFILPSHSVRILFDFLKLIIEYFHFQHSLYFPNMFDSFNQRPIISILLLFKMSDSTEILDRDAYYCFLIIVFLADS